MPERLDWKKLPECIETLERVAEDVQKGAIDVRITIPDSISIGHAIDFLNYMQRNKTQQRKYHKTANIKRKIAMEKLEASLSAEDLAAIEAQAEEEVG